MAEIYRDIKKLIEKINIKNGQTISFHHHLREGDMVMGIVIKAAHELGIKNLRVCSSSIMKCHDFLTEYIDNGTVERIETSGLREKLGEYVLAGKMDEPVIIRSHGGRARAVGCGETEIDVAFLAASSADSFGNATGITGKNAFGSMGYGIWESKNAAKTVIVTDDLSDDMLEIKSVCQSNVDAVLVVDEIGDTQKIKAGSLRIKKDPLTGRVAQNTAEFLMKSGIKLNNAGIQMGSGGISLQTVKYLEKYMAENEMKFSFAIGGITGMLVDMLNCGIVKSLADVQSFDSCCAGSMYKNRNHHEIDVNTYANPLNKNNMVNSLDIAILSALEIDTEWNVNVITGSNGKFMGAVGGHQDVAEGCGFTIIVSPLIRGRIPVLTDRVNTLVTKGEFIDAFICEYGVCVKPEHEEIIEKLNGNGIKNLTLRELYDKTLKYVGKPEKPVYGDKTVAIVQDRYGNTLSEIKNLVK